MRQLKYSLLFVGLAGISASIYGFIAGSDLTINLMSLICGSSLLFGYYEIRKKKGSTIAE